MAALTLNEQKNVRTALRYLRNRVGAWQPLADGLHVATDTIEKVVNGRRPVTASLAFSVSRLAGVSFDHLIEGHYLPGACPNCGYVSDFADEETQAERIVTEAGKGLRLVP